MSPGRASGLRAGGLRRTHRLKEGVRIELVASLQLPQHVPLQRGRHGAPFGPEPHTVGGPEASEQELASKDFRSLVGVGGVGGQGSTFDGLGEPRNPSGKRDRGETVRRGRARAGRGRRFRQRWRRSALPLVGTAGAPRRQRLQGGGQHGNETVEVPVDRLHLLVHPRHLPTQGCVTLLDGPGEESRAEERHGNQDRQRRGEASPLPALGLGDCAPRGVCDRPGSDHRGQHTVPTGRRIELFVSPGNGSAGRGRSGRRRHRPGREAARRRAG